MTDVKNTEIIAKGILAQPTHDMQSLNNATASLRQDYPATEFTLISVDVKDAYADRTLYEFTIKPVNISQDTTGFSVFIDARTGDLYTPGQENTKITADKAKKLVIEAFPLLHADRVRVRYNNSPDSVRAWIFTLYQDNTSILNGAMDPETGQIFLFTRSIPLEGGRADPLLDSTGNPIGGGTGYHNIILPGNPQIKYTVTNYAEFASALTKKYMKGDIIYVPETASIDMTGHPGVVIPRNVTIASNRGSDGSLGGRFFWLSSPSDSANGYQTGTMFYITTDDVRITGLRLEGPHMTTDRSIGDGKVRSAMDLHNAKGLEVDNCEMYGWSYTAVDIETSTGQDALYELGLNSAEIGSAIANIHHNYIHHCQMGSLGYGILVTRGTALVKANLFDYTRHAITGSGLENEGYEASYNIHLGHGLVGSVFDVHGQGEGYVGGIAGTKYKIHHNTLNYSLDYSVGIRGTPIQGAWIENNRFQWWTSEGIDYPPVYQSGGTDHVYMTQNLIGPDQVLYPEGPITKL